MKAILLVVVVTLGYVPRAHAADDAPLVEEATGLKCYAPEQRANIAKALSSAEARAPRHWRRTQARCRWCRSS